MDRCAAQKEGARKGVDLPNAVAVKMLVGEVAMNFSTLEFFLTSILSKLLDPSPEGIAGSLVCSCFTISQTLQHLRKVAKFRLAHMPEMRKQLADLCAEADSLRITRNLFAHGMWSQDPKRLGRGEAVCRDMRWKISEEGTKVNCTRGKEHVFDLRTLMDMLRRTARATGDAQSFDSRIPSADMLPMAADINQEIERPT